MGVGKFYVLFLLSVLAVAESRDYPLPHENWRSHAEAQLDWRNPLENYTAAPPEKFDSEVKVISDAQEGLLAKVMMIRQAQHTIDLSTFIFEKDNSGYIILEELRKALVRGVSVRLLVDSLGSPDVLHNDLKALLYQPTGFMKDADGKITDRRAKVEVMTFNPVVNPHAQVRNIGHKIGNFFGGDNPGVTNWGNRRSHDKMLLIDGDYDKKAMAMVGGRNIGDSYYGVPKVDPHTYNDMEVVFRQVPTSSKTNPSLGRVMSDYFNSLFYNQGNNGLYKHGFPFNLNPEKYVDIAHDAHNAVLEAKTPIARKLRHMEQTDYLMEGFHRGKLSFLHELQNLTRRNAFTNPDPVTNPRNRKNGSSIIDNLEEAMANANETIDIVSPYLYLYPDEMKMLQAWLQRNPMRRLRIVTNSLYSADNVAAQALTDREVGPKFQEMFSAPEFKGRALIYAYGKIDGTLVGGKQPYGKMHAKFVVIDGKSSVVTSSNGDPRSRYLNSELGVMTESSEVAKDLTGVIERLIDASYLFGTPEWQKLREHPALKTKMRLQRTFYPIIDKLGLRALI